MSLKFVVQEHHASHLHYDFRLEHDGALASWAVPKGPSMDPSDKRLALRVEDHDIDYAGYEGIIPDGQYGAGAVVTWDKGTYSVESWGEKEIVFELRGRKLKGGFALVKFKGQKGNEWLLIKRKDDHAEPGWKLEHELTPERREKLKEKDPGGSAS